MRGIRVVKLVRARSRSVCGRSPTATEQPAKLLVEVAVAVTCKLVVGVLAHLLIQYHACLSDAGEEQVLHVHGCGELCQGAK